MNNEMVSSAELDKGLSASQKFLDGCVEYGLVPFAVVFLMALSLGWPAFFAVSSFVKHIGKQNLTKKMAWAIYSLLTVIILMIAAPFSYVTWKTILKF